MKHSLANEWVKRTLFSDIHFAPQFLFQIDEQPAWEPRRRAWTGLDQQIDVAVFACVTPCEGTEDTHTPNAMSGRNGKNSGALFRA